MGEIYDRFKKDTAEHEMEIVLDQGVHRHLQFRRPGTYCYAFDVVTWPGFLAISGDMGASIFTRLPDMFEFFRDGRATTRDGLYINVSYWSEKLVANDGEARRYSRDVFLRALGEAFDDRFHNDDCDRGVTEERARLRAHIFDEARVDNAHEAIEWATNFKPDAHDFPSYADFRFSDPWEWTVTEYDWRLVWRLFAIAHAVKAYDVARATEPANA